MPENNLITKIKHYWDSKSEKQKHAVRGVVIIILVLGIISGAMSARHNNRTPILYEEEEGIFEVSDNDNVKDLWVYDSEQKLSSTTEDVESLKKENTDLKNEITDLKEQFLELKNDLFDEFSPSMEDEVALLRAELEELRKKNSATNKISKNKTEISNPIPSNNFQGSDPFHRYGSKTPNQPSIANNQKATVERSPGIEVFTMPNYKSSCMESDCVSAGSYAFARLLTTGDVETGLNSASDPQPMLFRIESKARGAKKHSSREYRETDIEGCVVIGSAEGKINTEKAYVRLIKMTCENSNGESITQNIEGYVTKASSLGIRGKVIDGTGGLIKNAMLAGLTGQLGSATAQKFNPSVNFQDGFASTSNQSTTDFLASGVGEGIESSGNMIAEFYMDKAEQYSPVIEIAPGQIVEIVFMSEYRLDGSGIDNMQEREEGNHQYQQ